MKSFLAVGLLLIMPAAFADEFPTPPDLPPTPLARQLLSLDPHVKGARAAKSMAETDARHLRASNYEWSVRLSGQQRRYDVGGKSNEWNVELQRPFRLPGKASLDKRIGEAGLSEAEAGIGESTHEAARALVERWILWLGAIERHRLLQEQEQLVLASRQAVGKRVEAGDASRLESSLAATELAVARRMKSEAQAAEAQAIARLRAHFPGIDTTSPPRLADPVLPEGDLVQWRARILEHSDPIRIARAKVERLNQQAERAQADRLPDPTVGIFTSSEVFQQERVIGLNVSIPIPGSHRSLVAKKAQQAVALAEQELESESRQLAAEIEGGYAAAHGSHSAWLAAEDAASAAKESAALMTKAYSLGEADLQSRLLSQRQDIAAAEAALDAKVSALRAYYLLLVDGHYLWDLAHED